MKCANCPKETTDPANCYEDEGFLRIDGIGEWVCSEECEEITLAATNKCDDCAAEEAADDDLGNYADFLNPAYCIYR